ncbi:hypothetical protein N7G274_006088 [Stereocaulon virgatum]|uniref:DUF7918 domain-containing protein n=1 Tax=Stereocaulon virgatum TaxID=373712 RepID=A0ABR4A5G4_9LECA
MWLGEVQTSKAVNYYETISVNSKEPPIAIFKFNYRSRKALQGLHLIPRTPSPPRNLTPVPLEERPIDDLALEEMRELLRRQRARQRTGYETITRNDSGAKPEADVTANRSVKRQRDQKYDNILASASE